MSTKIQLAVSHVLTLCRRLVTVGWFERASPPVGSFFSASMTLPDTEIDCNKAGLAIALAAITTTSLAVNLPTSIRFLKQIKPECFRAWPSHVRPLSLVGQPADITLQVTGVEYIDKLCSDSESHREYSWPDLG